MSFTHYFFCYLHFIDLLMNTVITGITGQDGAYLAELLLIRIIRFIELIAAQPQPIFGA